MGTAGVRRFEADFCSTFTLKEGHGMDSFVIEGGHRLYGRIRINGSKNAALPMLAVALRISRLLALYRTLLLCIWLWIILHKSVVSFLSRFFINCFLHWCCIL